MLVHGCKVSNYVSLSMYICMYVFIICTYILCIWLYPVAQIIKPPENITVCNGSNVTISCGYQSSAKLPVVWTIGDVTYFDEDYVDNDPRYHLNNKSNPEGYSLTIYYVNYTTTVRCGICSPLIYSTYGTETVGMYPHSFILYICVHCVQRLDLWKLTKLSYKTKSILLLSKLIHVHTYSTAQ